MKKERSKELYYNTMAQDRDLLKRDARVEARGCFLWTEMNPKIEPSAPAAISSLIGWTHARLEWAQLAAGHGDPNCCSVQLLRISILPGQ